MYGINNEIDERSLKAILAYNPLSGGRSDPESFGGLPEAEFLHAVERGWLYRPNRVTLDHDAAVHKLLDALTGVDEREQADLFLASLSTRRLDYRTGLGALALARHFPKHAFTVRPDGPYCAVCGLTAAGNFLDRNWCMAASFGAGAPIGTRPYALGFYLECQAALRPMNPTEKDLSIFSSILNCLRSAPPSETAKRLVLKQVRSIESFKASAEEAQCLLETLGYCGIIETEAHGGMLHRYVNVGLAPRKTHSSDWQYPVDFWTGKDGLNKEALRFWFGVYPEFTEFL